MKSKTSFFNGTLFHTFWKQFWPLPAIVFLTVLGVLGLNILQIRVFDAAERIYYVIDRIYNTATVMLILIACASILCAALIFRHLHSQREIQFYFGLPMSRTGMYITGYVTGFCMIALPMLAGFLICMVFAASVGAAAAAPALLTLFLVGMAGLVMLWSMAVLACVLAGHVLGTLLIYIGMNFAVMGVFMGSMYIAEIVFPGFFSAGINEMPVIWLTPLYRMIIACRPVYESIWVGSGYDRYEIYVATGFSADTALAMGIYTVVGLVIAAGTWYLYRIRKAETAGNMIAFTPVQVICKIFAALAVSAVGSMLILESVPFGKTIPFFAVLLCVLIFALIGWFIAEAIVRKSLRFFDRKSLVPCAALLAVLLVAVCLLKLDPLGRVNYVPEKAQIKAAEIDWEYSGSIHVDPEDAAALHQAVLDHREELTNNTGYWYGYDTFSIHYELADGSSLSRQYRVEDQGFGSEIETIIGDTLSRPDYCWQTWFQNFPEEGVTERNFAWGDITIWEYDENGQFVKRYDNSDLALNAKQAVTLYQAVCRDIEEGNLGPNGFGREAYEFGYVNFSISQRTPNPAAIDGAFPAPEGSAGIGLTDGMVHTLEYVEQLLNDPEE